LHAFYHDPPHASRDAVRDHLLGNLLAPGSPLRLVVAQPPSHGVVGFAAVFFVHSLIDPSPENRRQCQLKELFVSDAHRSRGVGAALLRWVARYALENGCGRMDWNVSASNRTAIDFYERLGGEHVVDRLSYRLSRAGLAHLSADSGGSPEPD
jgi:GNAT superfamily N-acetyltransferase